MDLNRRSLMMTAITGYAAGLPKQAGSGADAEHAALALTFGAKCDGLTDDAAALQRCIDHCLGFSPPTPMIIPGICLVSGTIYIDNQLDDVSNVFRIICCGRGAGFKKITPGPIFDSRLVTGLADDGLSAPSSHYVTFEGAIFQGHHRDTLVISSRFARVNFLGCTTTGLIRYVDAPFSYLQSFRWERCRSQGGIGWLATAAKAYDLYWDVAVESGGGGLRLGTLRGGYITGQMEGSTGPVIDIAGAAGLTIAIRYTEGNQREDVILGREGGASHGVSFIGGCYQPSASNAQDPSFFNIRLGRVSALMIGGYCSGRFFDDTLVAAGDIDGVASAAIQLFRGGKELTRAGVSVNS